MIRYFGLLGIAVEYLGVIVLLLITHNSLNVNQPISYYSELSSTRLWFSLIYTLAGILFGIFGFWVYKTFKLSKVYLVTLIVAILAQTALSWFPDTERTNNPHLWFAVIVMIAMPLMIYEFSKEVSDVRVKRFCWLLISLQLVALVVLPFSFRGGFSLLPEAVTVLAFQLWTVSVTFPQLIGSM